MVDYDRISWAGESLIDPAARSLRSLKVRRAFEVLDRPLTGKILDLGCGEGGLARTLHRLFPQAQVHGCDISSAQISRDRERDLSIDYRVCGETLPYDDQSFEAVFMMDVLEHVDEPEKLVHEIARVLRPGGKLLLHCPCEGQPGTLHWGYYKYNLGRDFKRELAGHVQHFMRSDVLRLMNTEGLACRRILYTYHLWGQFFDLLTFWRIGCQQENGEKSGWLTRLVVWFPWWRLMATLERLAYYESRLLGRLPLGMGMDAFFERKKD